MTELGSLVRRTADQLAAKHADPVVAAIAGDATEIHGSGLYEIGSVTKVFTALALARLVVAGTVRLDEPLADLLPAGARVPGPITLRQLATHTAGLPRLPTGMLRDALLHPSRPDPYAGCSTGMLLEALARTKLKAPKFRYSNFGAGLLGLALAHRAGLTYEALIDREIGAPLGLRDTAITVDPARLRQGHNARGKPVAAWHLADLAGAGGLRSTAADLVTFLRAQLAGTDPAIRLSREVEHRINPFAWVHLGWMGRRLHDKQGGHLQIWHNGGTGGFVSFVGFDPEKQVGVIVLSNTQRSVDRPAADLLRALQDSRG